MSFKLWWSEMRSHWFVSDQFRFQLFQYAVVILLFACAFGGCWQAYEQMKANTITIIPYGELGPKPSTESVPSSASSAGGPRGPSTQRVLHLRIADSLDMYLLVPDNAQVPSYLRPNLLPLDQSN